MQLGILKDICNNVYSSKMCIKSLTCLEHEQTKQQGPMVIDTGGEFATVFESFASRDYTMDTLPIAATTLALTVGGITDTFEFVANLGDEQVGNIPVLIDTDTIITSANLMAAVDLTTNYSASVSGDVTSVTATIAGDITAVEPASLTVSNIQFYVAPQNYFELPSCEVELYQNTCIEQKFDVADIMVELSIDEDAARDEAIIRADLWTDEMRNRIQTQLDELRSVDPAEYVSKTEETM